MKEESNAHAGTTKDSPEGDFFPLPLAVMQPGTTAPIDLYLREEEPPQRFVLYKRADTPLTDEVRQRLLDHGVEKLYVRTEDEDAFYAYVEEQLNAIMKDDLMPVEQAMPIVYQTGTRIMKRVLEDPRSGENIKKAAGIVEPVVDAVLKSERPVADITSLIAHDYYTYTHCMNVCVLLVAASKELLGVTKEHTSRIIGLGAILHDIGKSRIPEDILNKPGELTTEEWHQIEKHPEWGLEIARGYLNLADTAARIIKNHHEHYDGSGYPEGLSGEKIHPVVRLSTVIDVYDALTTERSYAEAVTPYEALKIMVEEMPHHFGLKELRGFIKFLGPRDAMRDARSG